MAIRSPASAGFFVFKTLAVYFSHFLLIRFIKTGHLTNLLNPIQEYYLCLIALWIGIYYYTHIG